MELTHNDQVIIKDPSAFFQSARAGMQARIVQELDRVLMTPEYLYALKFGKEEGLLMIEIWDSTRSKYVLNLMKKEKAPQYLIKIME